MKRFLERALRKINITSNISALVGDFLALITMFGKSILGGVTINVCYGEIGRYSIIF